ncbi:hypothetical protein [Mycobacterium kyorinense]|uniref:hypothetical protein n=1 Tax=Mycobacterium kyorinense TaxID=487514 RepID=UPI0012E7C324|nr:hypothetical protein [Mycobacterium kyorinense]
MDESRDVKEFELQRALEPVRDYLSGKEVNLNTVLAAYLRSKGLPASGQPWQRAKNALRQGASFPDAVLAAETRPATSADYGPVAQSDEPAPYSGTSLGWFPKQFGPGDLDGVGAKRLLGTPDLERASVLVREMAQNSWDARGTSPSIAFVLNLRQLDFPTIRVLRERVFTGDAPKTGLSELLRRDTVWALEVSDRGTVGLGGPIRNDLAVEQGKDTNFIDLVFNIGAPRDVHLGGGTYGFGKTISYLVSSVGAILISSRCEGSRGVEQRLIGSAIGDGFEMDGYRYTGRHWWGNAIRDEDRVEPVIGTLAEELVGLVFAKKFAPQDTGTSVLILAPELGGESSEEDVQMLVDAVVWNLWPKLVLDQDGRSRMTVSVQLNGMELQLPDIGTHASLSGHADCLRAVRATQSGRDVESLGLRYPVSVQEVRSERPRKLLGHIALTRYPVPRNALDQSRWVTLMRHQAELVVKYIERQPLDVGGFQWAAVFKPVAAVDDSFALAEPPAHDDWIPKAVQDKACRRDVNIALDRIRKLTDIFISPHNGKPSSVEPIESAAIAGDALAGLLGGIAGSAPDGRKPPSQPAGMRGARPRVEVVEVGTADARAPGWTRTWLGIQLSDSGGASLPVDVAVRVGIDGGSETDLDAIRILGWKAAETATDMYELLPIELAPDEVRRFEFEARSDLAIDIDAKVVGQ